MLQPYHDAYLCLDHLPYLLFVKITGLARIYVRPVLFPHLFFPSLPRQVCKEGILQLSADFFQLLEESRCIAWDSLIFMALVMLSGDLCIYVI